MSKPGLDPNTPSDSVPAPVRALLTVFEGPLAGVTFPGVDGDQLVTTAQRMDETAEKLAQAAAQVEKLREELTQQRGTLMRDAKKALEYARVFASDQPELKETVESIDLDSFLDGPKKKRARRPAKKKAAPPPEEETTVEVASPEASS